MRRLLQTFDELINEFPCSLSTCVVHPWDPRARFRLCNPAVHVWSALNLPGWMPGAPPSAQESRSERETDGDSLWCHSLAPRPDIMTNNLTSPPSARCISWICERDHFSWKTSCGTQDASKVEKQIIATIWHQVKCVHIAPDEWDVDEGQQGFLFFQVQHVNNRLVGKEMVHFSRCMLHNRSA